MKKLEGKETKDISKIDGDRMFEQTERTNVKWNANTGSVHGEEQKTRRQIGNVLLENKAIGGERKAERKQGKKQGKKDEEEKGEKEAYGRD